MENKTNDELLAEMNTVRSQQKSISSFSSVKDFMNHVKEIGEKKSKILAQLELNCWDENHQQELKEHFNYTDKKLKMRKNSLIKQAK
jgi:hypothetical protein